MSTDINKLSDELKDLKKQVNLLFEELHSLKENFESMGYSSDDNLLSDQEKVEIDKIRKAIKNEDFSELSELD